MYSKKALRAARTSWNTLSNLMDPKPVLFKDDKGFKTFYDELAKKIAFDFELFEGFAFRSYYQLRLS